MRKRTYDILSVGDKNRFFVRSKDNRVTCVHNCGYRMGHARFIVAAANPPYFLTIDNAMSKLAVTTYRAKNWAVDNLWTLLDNILIAMIDGQSGEFGGPTHNLFKYGTYDLCGTKVPGIIGPDGLGVYYPNLRIDGVNKWGKPEIKYDRWRGRGWKTEHLHGGKVTENVTQYLAFAVGKWQGNLMPARYPFVMNEHDAWVHRAPLSDAHLALEELKLSMRTLPPWLPDCPLDCAGGWGVSLGGIDK